MGHTLRGLRVCQDDSCKLPQNRDRTGACNIGKQFCRLFLGQGPLRPLDSEEKELNRLRVWQTCGDCED